MADDKKPVAFELTEARVKKLKAIADVEGRSVANILELLINRWLDGVEVSNFGIEHHPAFVGLMAPKKR
jgi:hypothetical protein